MQFIKLSILLFLFLIPSIVFGAETVDIDNSFYNTSATYGGLNCQSFKPKANTLSAISLFAYQTSAGAGVEFVLCEGDFDSNGTGMRLGTYPNSTLKCEDDDFLKKSLTIVNLPTATTSQEYKITFAEQANVNIDGNYYFCMQAVTDNELKYFYNINTGNQYPDGIALNYSSTDLRFKTFTNDVIFEDVIIVDLDGYGMNIIYPESPNHPYYTLGTVSGVPTVYNFKIAYSVPDYNEDKTFFYGVFSNPDFDLSHLVYYESELLSTLDPEKKGHIYQNVSITKDVPMYISFALYDNTESELYYNLQISVNDPTAPVEVANEDKGFWGNLFYWLFVPKGETLTEFLEVKNTMMNKAPFGYWTLAKQEYSKITTSSSTAPVLNLKVNGLNQSETNINMLNFQQTENLVGTTTMTLLYNIIKYSLLIGLIYYLFSRITNLFTA